MVSEPVKRLAGTAVLLLTQSSSPCTRRSQKGRGLQQADQKRATSCLNDIDAGGPDAIGRLAKIVNRDTGTCAPRASAQNGSGWPQTGRPSMTDTFKRLAAAIVLAGLTRLLLIPCDSLERDAE